MKTWIYIDARDVADEDTDGVMLSFDGLKVDAPTEERAYQLGAALMDTRKVTALRAEDPRDPDYGHGHFRGKFMNDFVMEISAS